MLGLCLLIVITAIYTGIGIAVCICLIMYSDKIDYNVIIPVTIIFFTLTTLVSFLFCYLLKHICWDLPLQSLQLESPPPPPPKPPNPYPPAVVENPDGQVQVAIAIYEHNPSPPQ